MNQVLRETLITVSQLRGAREVEKSSGWEHGVRTWVGILTVHRLLGQIPLLLASSSEMKSQVFILQSFL